MSIIINPGTEPLDAAISTEQNATANMAVFVENLRAAGITVAAVTRTSDDDHAGRYAYQIDDSELAGARTIKIEMPGLPLDEVRYMDEPGQDIWDFPRLYVDGTSWVWMFALRACQPVAHADDCPHKADGCDC